MTNRANQSIGVINRSLIAFCFAVVIGGPYVLASDQYELSIPTFMCMGSWLTAFVCWRFFATLLPPTDRPSQQLSICSAGGITAISSVVSGLLISLWAIPEAVRNGYSVLETLLGMMVYPMYGVMMLLFMWWYFIPVSIVIGLLLWLSHRRFAGDDWKRVMLVEPPSQPFWSCTRANVIALAACIPIACVLGFLVLPSALRW